jgi:hypothetical protein
MDDQSQWYMNQFCSWSRLAWEEDLEIVETDPFAQFCHAIATLMSNLGDMIQVVNQTTWNLEYIKRTVKEVE